MKRLKDEGKNQVEIARELGVTKGTVAYHFRSLGSEPDERFARRGSLQDHSLTCPPP